MLRSSAIISLISLLSSLVSFFNQLLIAKIFGASIHLDAYLIAVSVPLLVVGLISGLFSYSIVPTLVKHRTKYPQRYSYFAGLLFLVFIILAIWISSIAYFLAPKLIQLMAPTLPVEIQTEAAQMARISWMSPSCVMVISYLTAVHNTIRKFSIPVIVNTLPPLGMVTFMTLFASQLGVSSLVWGTLTGYLLAIPILYIGVAKEMVFKKFSFKLWRELLPIFTNIPLVLLSMLCFTIYGTVDAIWASRLGPSNLSYLGYGQRLVISIGNIVTLGPWLVLTPYLAEKAVLGEDSQFKSMLAKAIRMVITFSALLTLVISLVRVPLINLLFQRGAFDTSSTLGVASVLPGMLFGMVAMLSVTLIVKALHARGDVTNAAIVGSLGALIYFGLSGGLSQLIGLQGIVIAYVITWWLLLGICIWLIWKKQIRDWHKSTNFRFVACLILALIASGILMQLSQNILIEQISPIISINLAWRLMIVITVGIVSFIGITGGIFRIPEVLLLSKLLGKVSKSV
ncbi:MAG: lipid II flippase MurJ [Cyanobacteria bacterium J06633_8]